VATTIEDVFYYNVQRNKVFIKARPVQKTRELTFSL